MPDFYFRGNLIQYWQAIYAEYLRLTTVLGQEYLILWATSLKTTPPPDYVPKINDEVVFQFLLENKLPVVSIRADTVLGAEMINVQANIYPEAFEKTGEFAFSYWLEIQNSWLEKGWLINPAAHIAEMARIGMRSEQLPKPKSGADLIIFFDRYHQMKNSGRKYTLKQVAEETGFDYRYVRQLHSKYLKERGLAKPEKRTNKRTNKN